MLPTRHGVYFAVVLAAMLLMALNYHNGLAYLFTFLLGAMGVTSMLYTHRNLAGIRLTAGAGPPVFAGEAATFNINAENPNTLRRSAIWIHDADRAHPVDLEPSQNQSVEVRQPARRRGYLALDPIAVSSTFPIGLLHTWSKPLSFKAHCLVYPQPRGERPLRVDGGGSTPTQTGTREDGDDFVGLRRYQSSDPPRHVHWKAVARGQELLTKRFGGGMSTVWLNWDHLPGLSPEERLSQLSRWVLDAQAYGHRYGIQIPGRKIAPDAGPQHQHQCLKALALWSNRSLK